MVRQDMGPDAVLPVLTRSPAGSLRGGDPTGRRPRSSGTGLIKTPGRLTIMRKRRGDVGWMCSVDDLLPVRAVHRKMPRLEEGDVASQVYQGDV